jgi:hypothetical protein
VADVDLSHLATKADLDAAKAETARIDKLEEGVKESIRFCAGTARLVDSSVEDAACGPAYDFIGLGSG